MDYLYFYLIYTMEFTPTPPLSDEYLIFILLVNALNQLGHEILPTRDEFDRRS